MDVSIDLVDINNKKVLAELIIEYQQEILGQENIGEYKYLNSYWQKPDRYPYFIKIDSKVAGFALVNSHTVVEKGAKNIAEFYIKPEYRNKGIGKLSAKKIFDTFHGKWEVRELDDNILAQKFWRKVINEYTNGNYSEIMVNNKDWQGLIQSFDNGT